MISYIVFRLSILLDLYGYMKKFRWLIIYVSIVLVFAGIYSVLWERSPDSFIVNDDLNTAPFVKARNLLWGDGDFRMSNATTLADLEKTLHKLYLKISEREKKSDEISAELDELTSIENAAYEKMEEEREVNIEKYRRESLSSYEDQERKYVSEIKKQEEHLSTILDPEKRLPLIIKLGDKRIEYANFRVIVAQKKYGVSRYIISNFGSFASKETINKVKVLQDSRINFLIESSELQLSAGKIREKILDLLKMHYQERKSRLNFVDFLYYSIGISTTTTFGDITANSKVARAFVGFQLILCVIIIGLFLGGLSNNRADNALQRTQKPRH